MVQTFFRSPPATLTFSAVLLVFLYAIAVIFFHLSSFSFEKTLSSVILSILMIDLDGFKSLNDRLGHLRGDQILKKIARLLAEQIRSSDLLARFGGDEFIAILPQTEEVGASVVMEKITQAVNQQTFDGYSLSVSIGMSRIRPGLKLEEMLEESDRDLYVQKQQKHAARSMVTQSN